MATYQDQLDGLEHVKAWLLAQNQRHEVLLIEPLGWRVRVYNMTEYGALYYLINLFDIVRMHNLTVVDVGYQAIDADGSVSQLWVLIQPISQTLD